MSNDHYTWLKHNCVWHVIILYYNCMFKKKTSESIVFQSLTQ